VFVWDPPPNIQYMLSPTSPYTPSPTTTIHFRRDVENFSNGGWKSGFELIHDYFSQEGSLCLDDMVLVWLPPPNFQYMFSPSEFPLLTLTSPHYRSFLHGRGGF
jgi:hypothetical protein